MVRDNIPEENVASSDLKAEHKDVRSEAVSWQEELESGTLWLEPGM